MYDDNDLIQGDFSVETDYVFTCHVPRASPASSIRWLKNSGTDVTDEATTQNELLPLGQVRKFRFCQVVDLFHATSNLNYIKN